jgi:hypothetical protein
MRWPRPELGSCATKTTICKQNACFLILKQMARSHHSALKQRIDPVTLCVSEHRPLVGTAVLAQPVGTVIDPQTVREAKGSGRH